MACLVEIQIVCDLLITLNKQGIKSVCEKGTFVCIFGFSLELDLYLILEKSISKIQFDKLDISISNFIFRGLHRQ